MNKLIQILLSIGIFSVATGCNLFSQPAINSTEVEVEAKASDFKIPKMIFDEIDAEVSKDTPQLQSVYLFAPLKVLLHSQSDIVKSAPTGAVQISYPNGGGELDLKEHIEGQGSFSLSFPAPQFKDVPPLFKLYFLSDSPRRKIDGEEFGLGCGKMAYLKDQFNSLQQVNFLKLNTSELRHLYVLSGTFIFVFRERNQVYLSHLHVKDSRYPDFYCSSLYKQ